MISGKVHRLCCFRMELSNEYERHCHAEVINEVYEGVPEHPQQATEWFLT